MKISKELANYHTQLLSGKDVNYTPSPNEKEIKSYIDISWNYLSGDRNSFKKAYQKLCNTKGPQQVLLETREKWQSSNYQESLEYINNNFSCLETSVFWKLEGLILMGFLNQILGNYLVAKEKYHKALHLAIENSLFERAGRCSYNLYLCHLYSDSFKQGPLELKRLENLCQCHQLNNIYPMYVQLRTYFNFERGNYQQCILDIEEALNNAKTHIAGNDVVSLNIIKAMAYLRTHFFDKFYHTISDIAEIIKVRHNSHHQTYLILLKVDALIEKFEIIEAKRLIQIINPLNDLTEDFHDYYYIQKIRLSLLGQDNLINLQEFYQLENKTIPARPVDNDLQIYLLLYRIKFFSDNNEIKLKALETQYQKFDQHYNHELVLNFKLIIDILQKDTVNAKKTLSKLEDHCKIYNNHKKVDYYKKLKTLFNKKQNYTLFNNSNLLKCWPYNFLSNDPPLDLVILNQEHNKLIINGVRDVNLPKSPSQSQLIKMMLANRTSVSFDKITESIFNTNYNPIIHDRSIYNLIKAIKQYFISNLINIEIINKPGIGYTIKTM